MAGGMASAVVAAAISWGAAAAVVAVAPCGVAVVAADSQAEAKD